MTHAKKKTGTVSLSSKAAATAAAAMLLAAPVATATVVTPVVTTAAADDFKAVLYVENTDDVALKKILDSNFTHIVYSFIHMHTDGMPYALGIAPKGTTAETPYPTLNAFTYYEKDSGSCEAAQSDLDKGKFPEDIYTYVTQKGLKLSKDLKIVTAQKNQGGQGTNWGILDKSNGYVYQITCGYYSNQSPTNLWFFDPMIPFEPNTGRPLNWTSGETNGNVWAAAKEFKKKGKSVLLSIGGAGDSSSFSGIAAYPEASGKMFAEAMKKHPGTDGVSIDNEADFSGNVAPGFAKMFETMTTELGYKPMISGAPYGATDDWYSTLMSASVYEKTDEKNGTKVKANYIDFLNCQTYTDSWDSTYQSIPDDAGIVDKVAFVVPLCSPPLQGLNNNPSGWGQHVESISKQHGGKLKGGGVWRQAYIKNEEAAWADAILGGLKKGASSHQ